MWKQYSAVFMVRHPLLFNYLWIAPHVLQIALAVVLIRQRLVREFPAFFIYTVFEVLQFVVLFTLGNLSLFSQYTIAWFIGEAISAVLRFIIIREIFAGVFGHYFPLKKWSKTLFQWATVGLTIAAVLIVAYTPGTETDRLGVAMNVGDRTVAIVQLGLLLFLVVLSRFLRFNWRSQVFGIALGFGVLAGLKLVNWVLSEKFLEPEMNELFAMFLMASYHCCVVFWVVTFLLPKRQAISDSTFAFSNLDRWNATLERFLQS
jgi:hypothetical protein